TWRVRHAGTPRAASHAVSSAGSRPDSPGRGSGAGAGTRPAGIIGTMGRVIEAATDGSVARDYRTEAPAVSAAGGQADAESGDRVADHRRADDGGPAADQLLGRHPRAACRLHLAQREVAVTGMEPEPAE